MNLPPQSAQPFLQQSLHSLQYTHLLVRAGRKHLVIYSQENKEEVLRARLTRLRQDDYRLSVANHRGVLEPTPYVGTLADLLQVLTGKLAAVLARWT
jgi:hypothetical protein